MVHRLRKTNRYFWMGMSLLFYSMCPTSSVFAQFYQPTAAGSGSMVPVSPSVYQRQDGAASIPQYQGAYWVTPQGSAVMRRWPNQVIPVSNDPSRTNGRSSGQIPPVPPEGYLQNPVLKSSGPPPPHSHTVEPGPILTPSQSGGLYTSPYESHGKDSYPIQAPEQVNQPREYLDGYYNSTSSWGWNLLPKDLLYKSYLGGPKEPRLGQGILYLKGTGAIWSLEAGGRVGLLRYGSGPGERPEGWQLDVWGAAFPRLNFNENIELDAVDFKVGVPLTWSRGPYQVKLEWNHISSHLGDEFMLRNPGFVRIDYLRDSFVLGGGYFVNPDLRMYADAEYAYNRNGGSEPWHFQFGFDYSPTSNSPYEQVRHPQPFLAVNGNLREEANFSGGVNVVAGLQWRGVESEALFRIGLQYYQGQSLQYEFFNDYEELIGIGMWYDF